MMRKIIVIEHITLDGVIQSPGSIDEDATSGFASGGWISGYSDNFLSTKIRSIMESSFDLLLGRVTYDIWTKYWPYHDEIWPEANRAKKYVVSKSVKSAAWENSQIINDNIISKITELKGEIGPELHIWGSSKLVQALMEHGIVDRMILMCYPIVIGSGKRLFGEKSMPSSFRLVECQKTNSDVVLLDYFKMDK